MSSDQILRVENVHKSYGSSKILEGINIDLRSGKSLAIFGRSGCGKTTLASSIIGLTSIDTGQIFVLGNCQSKSHREWIKFIGFAPQEAHLDPEDTVLDALYATYSLWGKSNVHFLEKAQTLLKEFEIQNYSDTPTKNLSGGNKKIVSLIKALVIDPKLLILDEPTAGVDTQRKYILTNHLKGFLDQGGAILLISHYKNEATALASDCAHMKDGKLYFEKDNASELLSQRFQIAVSQPLDEKVLAHFPLPYKKENLFNLIVDVDQQESLQTVIQHIQNTHCSIESIKALNDE